ncbi:MAG: class I SAM-dependent methyltransferase [Chloroflexi bacterium]|nr:MAG: class I SAM-dependent methyltransferase [Chloroflexota bacterium]
MDYNEFTDRLVSKSKGKTTMLTQEITSSTTPALRLADVSETGLLTLYGRAQETLTPDPILKDEKAVEITRAINPLLVESDSKVLQDLARGRVNPNLRVHIALRAKQYDQYALDFLARHPDGIIVNLGCGMDSRFVRISDARKSEREMVFFDLDLPEVIAVKKQFFQESERYHLLGESVFDYRWMDPVLAYGPRPVLFLAEGLFMYLDADRVKDLTLTLRARFPGSELVCEVVHRRWIGGLASKMVRFKMQGRLGIGAEAVYHFGVASSREMESWNPGIRFLDEWCYFDTRHPKLGWMRWFARGESMRHVQWTVHYRLG